MLEVLMHAATAHHGPPVRIRNTAPTDALPVPVFIQLQTRRRQNLRKARAARRLRPHAQQAARSAHTFQQAAPRAHAIMPAQIRPANSAAQTTNATQTHALA